MTLLDSWKFYSPLNSLPGDKTIPSIGIPGFGSDFQVSMFALINPSFLVTFFEIKQEKY